MRAMSGLSGLSAVCGVGVTSVTNAAGSSPSLWANANAIGTSDDDRATTDLGLGESSGSLDAIGFGFAIPGGSTILGIAVLVERSKADVGVVVNTYVQLLKAGSIAGTPVNDATDWPTTDAVATYGGAASLWGTTWSPTEINDADFGVQLVADEGSVGNVTLRVDQIRITVWYQ